MNKLAALFLALCGVGKSAPLDFERVLRCISAEEQGRWGRPGGACNISYGAWADRAPGMAYQMSGDEAAAMPIYRLHLQWLADQLAQHRIPVTPETLGTGWRWGLTKAVMLKGRSDYGRRTSNLYFDKGFSP